MTNEPFVTLDNLNHFKIRQDDFNDEKFATKKSIIGMMRYLGEISSVDDLPDNDNNIGDVYSVKSNGNKYMWNGFEWNSFGGSLAASVSWDDIIGKPDEFYVHPQNGIGSRDTGFYKVAIDEYGHVIGVADVTMDDLVEVGIVRLDGDRLVNGDKSVSELTLEHDNGGFVEMSAGDESCVVQIADDSGKVLPIGVSDGASAVGLEEHPVDYIYVENISSIDDADGKLVPNVETVKQYISDKTNGLTKISGGYGAPALGGNVGDLYIDYNTGDIYEFGYDENE